jgi:hypothetical protein
LVDLGVSELAAAGEEEVDLFVFAMDIPSMPFSKSSAFPVMVIFII